jgi:hypothetical protein
LMEFIELRCFLRDVVADHAVKASRLAALVRDVSWVLENLGMPSMLGIPRDLRMADDVLGAVDVILEHVKGAYDSGCGPWD